MFSFFKKRTKTANFFSRVNCKFISLLQNNAQKISMTWTLESIPKVAVFLRKNWISLGIFECCDIDTHFLTNVSHRNKLFRNVGHKFNLSPSSKFWLVARSGRNSSDENLYYWTLFTTKRIPNFSIIGYMTSFLELNVTLILQVIS